MRLNFIYRVYLSMNIYFETCLSKMTMANEPVFVGFYIGLG